ncbi:MAG: hypothetical protein HY879_21365 [Deltaproteobacteria bacterium]|nr:hypothetical protein [Deltaproteobacteria bacterium]
MKREVNIMEWLHPRREQGFYAEWQEPSCMKTPYFKGFPKRLAAYLVLCLIGWGAGTFFPDAVTKLLFDPTKAVSPVRVAITIVVLLGIVIEFTVLLRPSRRVMVGDEKFIRYVPPLAFLLETRRYSDITRALVRQAGEKRNCAVLELHCKDGSVDSIGIAPDVDVELLRTFFKHQDIEFS